MKVTGTFILYGRKARIVRSHWKVKGRRVMGLNLRMMRRGWAACSLLSLVLVCAACEPMDGNVRVRAENDLLCAEGHVKVTPAGRVGGNSRFIATGCSRTATYTCVVVEETGIPVCEREGE